MKISTSAEIRQAFLDFFKSKQHLIVASAPLVVKNDPTLMFINSGMAPFKDYFLGIGKPPHPRIADTQKCLRVSGKHNDLEEVGVDTYHHTMFEMLGNWSFGDYFKKEAIAWSWEFLTNVLSLDKDRLYVTIFEGNEAENIPKDDEAYNEWKKYIAEDRILLGNKKDNFWEMGDTGPCGPCTEIHVDCRPDDERKAVDGATLVNNDHPQVIEIWNNVFIQFNRKKYNSLELLPAKHVDTGMGFERLVRVIQGKTSNYDTDVFTGTISTIETITNKKYHKSDSKQDIAFRVLSDHIRAVSFTISDGQLPSNTGAGYVIRRILRRAVRYYFSYLERKEPLLHLLVPVLAEQFANVFPELKAQQEFVAKVILEEETSFLRTLENGLKKIDVILKENTSKNIDGKAAFELLDTYGFPIDLTNLIASENGFTVDENEFNTELQKQKERSRAASEQDVDDWIVLEDGKSTFIGYTNLDTETKVLKYRKIKSKGKEQYQIVLQQTPFYAESGGQVGDVGVIIFDNEKEIKITDTKKENDLIVHFCDALPQNINAKVIAKVDTETRKKTTLHHSATHLMHALRNILGTHVVQKGSLNNSENLRFDFSHFAKMSADEIQKVEQLVNQKIRENIPVIIKELPKDEALKLGAMALFGEKYGDVVRVVIMDKDYSVELCGGTHVGATGELGFFKIISESAVAAGVRRIEAVCGEAAEQLTNELIQQLDNVKAELKQPKDTVKAIQQLLEENTILKKEIEQYQNEKVEQIKAQLRSKISNKNGTNILIEQINGVTADGLKKIQFDLKNEIENLFFVATSIINNKPFISIIIAENLVKEKNLHAGNLVKQLAKHINGGGGGQAFYATAGGTNADGLATILQEVDNIIA
ncbi:MAG: alanine--tRNA ligase [Sphingobacteriales bacterium]|nr:MAG: alanine--tRNA ligase [Sphingobacteriales bacterium]